MNIKILVCCHKKDVMVDMPPYLPIQMGKSLTQEDLGITGDNTGDNISEKNKHYCELTGLYWAWKNMKDSEVVGLVHYRRYFDFHNYVKGTDIQSINTNMVDKLDFSVPESVSDNVVQGAIVLAKPHVYGCSLYDNYCQLHYSYEIKLLQNIIEHTQQKKYFDAFMHVMYLNNKLSHYNMFLMNRHNLSQYCEWMFPILQEFEKRIDLSSYGDYSGRCIVFLAERLLNVWCHAEKKDICYYPVMLISDSMTVNNHRRGIFRIAESVLKWSIVRLTSIKYRSMYKIN